MGEPIINKAEKDLGIILEALAFFVLVWTYLSVYTEIEAPK